MTTRISELGRSVRSGAIQRETYWTEMNAHHMGLREYHELLQCGAVAQIEIDARELRIVMNDGSKFQWLPEDLRIATTLAVNYGMYEAPETAFLIKASGLGRTTIDIGANIGWHTIHMGCAGKREPQSIHAFEPVPATFEALERNVELNGLGSVVVANNCGLSDNESSMTMFVPRFNGSGAASLAKLHPTDESVEVSVELKTLDGYCNHAGVLDIGLIKCDVEGAELFVVRGGMQTLERDKPVLFLELLRKWSKAFGYHPNEVLSLLATIGYSCWYLDGEALVEIPAITDETIPTNFVFLQKGKHDALIPG